jgi:hypothetical protein
MHVILEGVLPKTFHLLAGYLHENGIMRFSEICEILNTFPYRRHHEESKPNPISPQQASKHTVRQSASQWHTLALLLPLMIGETCGKEDNYWQLFLQLLTIMGYLFSPSIPRDQVAALQQEILVFLNTFR